MTDWTEPVESKDFGNGTTGQVLRMTFGKGRLCVGPTGSLTYDAGWCYETVGLAVLALRRFDGVGDPVGWFKNLQTQEYQPEFTDQQIDPKFVAIAPSSRYYTADVS